MDDEKQLKELKQTVAETKHESIERDNIARRNHGMRLIIDDMIDHFGEELSDYMEETNAALIASGDKALMESVPIFNFVLNRGREDGKIMKHYFSARIYESLRGRGQDMNKIIKSMIAFHENDSRAADFPEFLESIGKVIEMIPSSRESFINQERAKAHENGQKEGASVYEDQEYKPIEDFKKDRVPDDIELL